MSLLAIVALPRSARAEESDVTAFEAVASADGLRISVAAPSFILADTLLDLGAPVSQALVNGLGNAEAYASYPFPGDVLLETPGIIFGLNGLPAPPEYPFIARSTFPTRTESSVEQPGYTLFATSKQLSSQSVAEVGGGGGGLGIARMVAMTRAARDVGRNQISAEASSTAEAVSIADVLRIGRIEAVARIIQPVGGEARRESSLSVGAVTIDGVAVDFTEQGLVLAGTRTPLPETNSLAQTLAQAGVSVRYLAPVDSGSGIESAALEVEVSSTVPGGPTTVMTYTFGRARALVSADVGVTRRTPDSSDDDGLPTNGAASESGVVPPRTAASPSLAHPTPATAEAGLGGGGTSAPVARSTVGAPVASGASSGQLNDIASAESFYLILVVGAVLALLGAQLIRVMGVRLAWTRW